MVVVGLWHPGFAIFLKKGVLQLFVGLFGWFLSTEVLYRKAMVRYVAQRGQLWGANPTEAALVDMVAEGIKDARGEADESKGWGER